MTSTPTHKPAKLRIGIVYDRIADYEDPQHGGIMAADRFAEFEPESTIDAMEQAIILAGHTPVRIGSPHRLLDDGPDLDLVWNIGEGYGTRNREAWAPVLCEMKGVPCLGSDAYALTVTLDKALTKQIARGLGIPTAEWQVVPWRPDGDSAADHLGQSSLKKASAGTATDSPDTAGTTPVSDPVSQVPNPAQAFPEPALPFPQFLKPRYEGTSKGITADSIVRSPEQFRSQCLHLLKTYRQDVLAEPFLPGAELTCALAGHPLQPLPVMERGLHASGIGSHAMDQRAHLASIAGHTAKPGTTAESNADDPGETSRSKNTSHDHDSPGGDGTSNNDSHTGDAIRVTGAITPEIERDLTEWSIALCEALDILDFVRMDFKLDADGRPMFLEANPLPTFGVDSTFAILAEIEGVSYPEYLARILSSAIRRFQF
jgi:D-alanine-D-alanine ligase